MIKQGIYSFLERFIQIIFGFGSLFLLIRQLTKEEFGIWALYLSITSLIEVTRIGLTQNALIKFLTSAKKEEQGLIGTASLVLNISFTIFIVFLLVSLSKFLSHIWSAPVLEYMLYIYGATTVFLLPLIHFNIVQQSVVDFKGLFWANFTLRGLFFGYVFWCFIFNIDIDLISLTLFQIFAAAAASVISYFFVRKYLSLSLKISKEWVLKLFHFGKYTFGTNLGTVLYRNVDRMMIGAMINTSAVAIFDIASRISNLIEIPAMSVARIVYPQSARKIVREGNSGIKELYEKSVGAILGISVPGILLVIIFPFLAIRIIAGSAYFDSVPILEVTMLYAFFVPFAKLFGIVLDSAGKPHVNFYFIVLSTVLNIVSNYLYISHFGTIGAAYGTFTSMLILFILNQILLKKIMGISTVNTLKEFLNFYLLLPSKVKAYLNNKSKTANATK